MNEFIPTIPEPDERFINTLEQKLREGIRRRAMLDSTDRTVGGIRRKGMHMLATASLMLLSLMLGAAGTYTVVHHDLAPQRALHVQRAEILLERAQMRLEQSKADLAEVQHLFKQGLVDEFAAACGRQRFVRAEAELRCRELDLKETRITGRPAVNDLAGPLIDGEDYITHRLLAQTEAAELEIERIKTEYQRIEALAQKGLVSAAELHRARADLDEAEQARVRLERRIDLRRSFIEGKMTAEEVELRALQRDAEAEYMVSQSRLDAAEADMQRIAALHEQGSVTNGELRAARTELRDARSNLDLAAIQLKMIRERLEPFEEED